MKNIQLLMICVLSTLAFGCQSDKSAQPLSSSESSKLDTVRYNKQDTVSPESGLAKFDPSKMDNASPSNQPAEIVWEDEDDMGKSGHAKKAEDEK